jgi:hypothetical protein
VGNSGTKLAPEVAFNPKDAEIVRAKISEFQQNQDFGFTTLRADGDSWRVEAHDRAGKIHVQCSVPMKAGRCAE